MIHKPSAAPIITRSVLALALLPAVYVAAYFALVEVTHGGWSQPGQPRYGLGIPVEVFSPIHALDRLLRPGTWETKP